MIAIIADDLTGAAELAGAAHALGLTAEVQTAWQPSAGVDVIALDTNTRSLSADEAARKTGLYAREVAASRPEWIYKKTDSVLRGHSRREIESILDVCRLHQSWLVPANPSKGRIISHGIYTIHGVPLHQTDFARDPDHPRRSAAVGELLGQSSMIAVPDTVDTQDLARHAASLGSDRLAAGGVDFFEALLKARRNCLQKRPQKTDTSRKGSTLFVCGSAAAWNRGRKHQFVQAGMPVVTLPPSAFNHDWNATQTSDMAAALGRWLDRHASVAVAIGDHHGDLPFPASTLAVRLCEVASMALDAADVDSICAEGGATASALLQTMNCQRLEVVRQWAGGVVELRPVSQQAASIIMKVGSYDWPAALLRR